MTASFQSHVKIIAKPLKEDVVVISLSFCGLEVECIICDFSFVLKPCKD